VTWNVFSLKKRKQRKPTGARMQHPTQERMAMNPKPILVRLLVLAFVLCGWHAGVLAQRPALGAYTTRAGLMPVGENPESPTAELFYTAYTLDGADVSKRPITFLFNGGPGAASVYLHLTAVGPMTVAMAGDGSFPSVPARLQPNPHSWLHFTDLVFIDPVDTGFSRALPGPQGKADPTPYFEVEADLHSLGQFMRRYLTVNGRWPSPKAVAGESYGGQRVAALSKLLMEDYDINLNRAVLISPALRANLPGLDSRYGLISMMALLPTQAAVAAAHGRNALPADSAALPAALADVERYALTDFLSGWPAWAGRHPHRPRPSSTAWPPSPGWTARWWPASTAASAPRCSPRACCASRTRCSTATTARRPAKTRCPNAPSSRRWTAAWCCSTACWLLRFRITCASRWATRPTGSTRC
jgi:hypothetical protein